MDKSNFHHDTSLGEVNSSVDISSHKGFRRVLAYFGPAYLVSVGYMDPGNWATDLQGGAQFGYRLIWVLLMSNFMALILQNLSARLGIVRKKDLAQASREIYPPVINFCLYILAELAIAACDLAEILGMAIGINLLTGIPLIWGVSITVLDTFLLMWLQKLGIRKLEAFILGLVSIIALSFLVELIFARPDLGEAVKGFIPTRLNKDSLYIAVGIIGATVMPHNLYLHSALVQTRKIKSGWAGVRRALKYNFIDSFIALNGAFFVNAAILILAASVFYTTGHTGVAKIEDAYRLLSPLLGRKIAPTIFAIALIASGQSSTITGTLAGQIVMEGYLSLRLDPLLRRLITRLIAIVPAVLVIYLYGDSKVDDLLIFSQVVLSLQLGFAIIPLIHFVSDKVAMGEFAINLRMKIVAWLIATILVYLNVQLVAGKMLEVYESNGNLLVKFVISIAALVFAWLFCAMAIIPLIQRRRLRHSVDMHPEALPLDNLKIRPIKNIAVALDFSNNDGKLIAEAIGQGNMTANYTLLHIIESVSANYLGASSDDAETQKDRQRLEAYAIQLTALGYNVSTQLGYRNRVKEIVRLVKESDADMLIVGAHRHRGLKDYLFGETIDAVRHDLDIAILIINVYASEH
jgi:manganese transport protein